MRVRAGRVAAIAAAMVGIGLAGAPTVNATFPGRNGEIVYSWLDGSAKAEWTGSGVGAFDTRAMTGRDLFSCQWGGHADIAKYCLVDDAAVSADGKTVAVVESWGMTTVEPMAIEQGVSRRLSFRTLAGLQQRSAPLAGPTLDPAWSPRGDQLVVTRYEGDDWGFRQSPSRLVVIDLDGREVGAVGGPGASDADWSARGEIAFVQGGNVWVTRLGGMPRRLTSTGGVAPSWSPDGRTVAFQRDGRIWTIRADGSRERRIGSGRNAGAPAWSPDGRYLAYMRADVAPGPERWTFGSVWVMRSDGRCPQAVRRRRGYYAYGRPSWASRPGKPTRAAAPVCGKKKPKRVKPKRKPRR